MTYEEIYKELNLIASEEDGDDFETMAKASINLHYRELLSEGDVDLERREFTFTTVANQSKYGMPLYVADVLNIEDDSNDRPLNLHSPSRYDSVHSGSNSTGTPEEAFWIGEYGVQRQPNSSGVLTIETSASADRGDDFKAVIHGMSSGIDTREEVTLSSSSVNTSTTFDAESNAIGIRRVVLQNENNTTFTGNVTIKDDDTNTLAVIPPYYGRSPNYQWWELWPTPTAVQTYVVRCLAHKPPLVNASDWPEIPEEYHDLLIYGPMAVLLAGKGKESSSQRAFQKYNERKRAFLGKKTHRGIRSRKFSNVTNIYIEHGSGHKIPNAEEA